MNVSQVSRLMWIPEHPEFVWCPGKITQETDTSYILEDPDGKTFEVPKQKAIEVNSSCLEGARDLLSLEDFNEGTLLHNIRVRYFKDQIYTIIGTPIIISINPYKKLPIYDDKIAANYKELVNKLSTGSIQLSDIPPHLFKVAEDAYQSLMDSNKNQSLIISGESGAGKTEAAKIILTYITLTSQSQKHEAGNEKSSIEDRVLDSNPILEAFGNAKTIRNDNSSRFGKFIEVHFDQSGKIQSANIMNYLLEKSRITFQQEGERNYHIFYQMCLGFTSEEKKKYLMKDVNQCTFLSHGDSVCKNMEDVEDFEKTRKCMDILGFSDQDKDEIFSMMSGILHIGEINFKTKANTMDEGAEVDDESIDHLKAAAQLFQINPEELANLCCTQNIVMGGQKIVKAFRVEEAIYNRDALAKEIYGKFFDWLVDKVNLSISGKKSKGGKTRIFGILDIFGFEIFQNNSFEQLCINYTNEKLQQHFNNHIFKLEQKEYESEAVSWKNIQFIDNQVTIDLIEKPPTSIFSLLEDECTVPKGSDQGFCNKIFVVSGGKNPSLSPIDRRNPHLFGVRHYAGEVIYDCKNFVDKNKDNVNPNIPTTLATSKNSILKGIFVEVLKKESEKKKSSLKDFTICFKFRKQLNDLVNALTETNPFYVRCIKPNGTKSPGEFNSEEVQRQLRCAGMLEAIRIRKNGYSIRKNHREFVKKYFPVASLKTFNGTKEESKHILEKFMQMPMLKETMQPSKARWAIGKTKVMMKDDLVVLLDQAFYSMLTGMIVRIQRARKKLIMRRKLKVWGKVFRLKKLMKLLWFGRLKRNTPLVAAARRIRKCFYKIKGLRIIKKWKKTAYLLISQKQAAGEGENESKKKPQLLEKLEEEIAPPQPISKDEKKPPKKGTVGQGASKGQAATEEKPVSHATLESLANYKTNLRSSLQRDVPYQDDKVFEESKRMLEEKERMINSLSEQKQFFEDQVQKLRKENKYLLDENAKKKQLYDKLVKLEQEVADKEYEIQTVQNDNEKLYENAKGLLEKLDAAELLIEEQKEEINKHKKAFEEMKSNAEFFKNQLDHKQGDADVRWEAIKQKEQEVELLQKKISKLVSESKESEREKLQIIETLKAENLNLTAELQTKAQKFEEKQVSSDSNSAVIDQLKKQLEESRRNEEFYKKQVQEKQDELDSKWEIIKSKEEEIEELQEQLRRSQASKDSAHNRRASGASELTLENQSLKNEIQKRDRKLKEMQNEFLERDQQYSQLKERVRDLEQSNKEKDRDLEAIKKELLKVRSREDEIRKIYEDKIEALAKELRNHEDKRIDWEASTKNSEEQKDIKQLNQEVYFSKSVNQHLVKLLKLKNLQLSQTKILYNDINPTNVENARALLKKFEEEEKKLVKIIDKIMKEFDATS